LDQQMSCPALADYTLSDHARLEMQRRGLSEGHVMAVLRAPDQSEELRPGRCVYQSKIVLGDAHKMYLLRVFVDIDCDPPQVVTAYLTSKVEKYWR
jgi:hypothetical protein